MIMNGTDYFVNCFVKFIKTRINSRDLYLQDLKQGSSNLENSHLGDLFPQPQNFYF